MRRPALVTSMTAVAAVAVFSLVAATPAGQAAVRPSSAAGVVAEGQVPVAATPYVESSDGRERSSSALDVPKNPLLGLRAATVKAGNDTAAVEILDLSLGKGALDQVKVPPELKQTCASLPSQGADDLPIPDLPLPDLGLPVPTPSTKDLPVKNLPELCELLLTPPSSVLGIDAIDVWCDGDQGGVDLGSVTLLGQKIDLPSTAQGATIPAAPLATITLNKQTKRADGSFTVTAVEINLGDGAEVIRLGTVTCATPAPKAKPTPSKPVQGPPLAPVPTPVQTRHPVTG